MKKTVFALMCGLSLLSLNNVGAENIRLDEVVNTAASVTDILREIPGLSVAQQGGLGQPAFIYIRGAESRHTLVLIDGIIVNSPITGEVDFADLTVGDIERVEVVKGPLSSLYGSGAVGGVIRIFTKRGNITRGTLDAETGSFDTIRENVSTSLKAERYDLQINASHVETEGFSAVKAGTEKDGYNGTVIASNFGMPAGDTGRFEITARLTDSRTDLDVPVPAGSPAVVVPANDPTDDNNLQQQKQWNLLGLSYSSNFSENWSQRLSFTNSDAEFIFSDNVTPLNRGRSNTMIKTAGWQHNIRNDDGSALTLGYEWQQQHSDSQGDTQGGFNKTFSNNAVYIQDQRGLKSPVQLSAALRWDDSTLYDSEFTYSAGITQTPDNGAWGVKWFANYGTGFKGPDLNDLFRPEDNTSVGNPNLKPEKSIGWEIGTEQVVYGSSSLSVSYFRNSYEDMIQWIPNTAGKYQPQNRRKAISDGIEASLKWQAGTFFRIEGSYTYNDTEDSETHFYLQRRPLNKYGAVLLLNPSGNLRVTINFNHSGRRVEWEDTDSDGKPDRQIIMPAYSKTDLSGSYKLSNTAEIFFRIENLFDEDYTEAIGYNTAGVSSYSGVRIVL